MVLDLRGVEWLGYLQHRGVTNADAQEQHHRFSRGVYHHRWDWMARVNASSKKATACSRETEGNPSRK